MRLHQLKNNYLFEFLKFFSHQFKTINYALIAIGSKSKNDNTIIRSIGILLIL